MRDKHRGPELDRYLGEAVEVTLFDGAKIRGVIEYEEKGFRPPVYRKGGFYCIGTMQFRKTHVKKIRRA